MSGMTDHFAEKAARIERAVIDQIKTVYDPEIPVDIYELGLIYNIAVRGEDGHVAIQMTLTTAGCPVAGQMPHWVENAVYMVEGVESVEVQLTFNPPWDREMMSEEAKIALGLF